MYSVTYEVFVFYNGQWKVDSMYDDREIALFEAKRVIEGPRCMGVRVAEQRFRDATATYASRTIFRKTKLDGVNNADLERQKKSRRETVARTAPTPRQDVDLYNDAGVAAVASIDYGLIFRLLLGAIVVLAGIAAILVLRGMH